MTFDDFNYHQYNKFILVDPDNPNACESTETEEEQPPQPATPSKKSSKKSKHDESQAIQGGNELKHLKEEILNASIKDEFQFNEFDTDTVKQKEEAKQRALAK